MIILRVKCERVLPASLSPSTPSISKVDEWVRYEHIEFIKANAVN